MAARSVAQESSELLILSLLAEGPRYGYSLSKEIASRSEDAVRLTPGVLYPLLKGMESQALIESTWEEVRSERREGDDEGEGRRRKWYRITPKGRTRLAQRVESHHAWRRIIDLFLPAQKAEPGEGRAEA
ncbi:MAG: helix-turn-helix transcriptional regulator [Phycisphaeraceae bacterium]|nr:MAG: helix-turn-helix transcriptional regulator [Phycisphaeraceae bacterium]